VNRAAVSVGSNLLPEEHVAEARRRLSLSVRLAAESEFETTKPVGNKDQPDFLNGVWLIETEMELDELRRLLHGIEDALGRVRGRDRFGPRTMDLDVVVWNGRIIDPDAREREYLRKALLQVMPELGPML
jgi:2-amino-4-hydroxy-6-hydroxymethyldihydropteridine diphosphokinase